jgi:ubiquinone/menaquinone biosynthesis C-methylase UbiE
MPENIARPMSNLSFRLMASLMGVWDVFHPAGRAERHLSKIPLKPGITVVDYACGPGRYAIPVAVAVGPAGKVYAVDIQPLAVETVRRKAARKRLKNVEGVVADSYHTGIPDGIADLVLMIDAIHMVSDRGQLFQEIHRLLKNEGFLFVEVDHISPPAVLKQIEESRLFHPVKIDGKTMILSRT